MSDSKPPKRDFNPRSHAMIYLMAMVYLAWLVFQMVKEYLAGGPDAPSFPLLVGGVAVLGGGCVLLGILARKMSAMAPKEEEEADSGERVSENDAGKNGIGEKNAVNDVKNAGDAKTADGEEIKS